MKPSKMHLNHRQSGLFFLALGLFFPILFLIGGGILTATNGLYWTTVFAIAYAASLIAIGPMIYRGVLSKAHRPAPPETSSNQPRRHQFIAVGMMGLAFLGSKWFIESPAFTTTLGVHSFLVVMAACLSCFLPLGLGMLRRSVAIQSSPTNSFNG
jgi:hypothetical protein